MLQEKLLLGTILKDQILQLKKKENTIVVTTDDEMKAGQVNDMLVTHFVRRKVDPLCLKKNDMEKAGGE